MCSTRNDNLFRRLRRASTLVALAAAATVPTLGGCQNRSNYKPFPVRAYEALSYKRPAEPAMDPTGPEDAAMAHRQWRQQEALYANMGTVAWANRFRYNAETSQRLRPYAGIIADPFMFLAQSFYFPFTFIRAAPFTHETYRPAEFEPTFTGNPPREGLVDLSAGGTGGTGGNGGGATGMPTVSPRLPPPSLAYPAGVPSVVPNAPQPSGPPGSPRPVGPNGAGGAGGGSTGSGAGGGSSGGGAGGGK